MRGDALQRLGLLFVLVGASNQMATAAADGNVGGLSKTVSVGFGVVGNDSSVSAIGSPAKEFHGPVAALFGAGVIIGAGFVFEVWSMVLLGPAVGGGLATLSVLALDVVSTGEERSSER